MTLLPYLGIGVLMLWTLRHFVYVPLIRGQLSPWLGALISGLTWASVPILLVLLSPAELDLVHVLLAAILFVSTAAGALVIARMGGPTART